MNISIKTIPHSSHRYETVGDYFIDENGVQQILVSDMRNEDYELLVAIHELLELHLCKKRGITEEEITNFDKDFEFLRDKFPKTIGEQEPGHMVSAPYHKEHCFAEKIERMLAEELGVDWDTYNNTVVTL